jgi:thymidylate synthase ThyX
MQLCKLVWDGKALKLPEELGKPREDQLQGSDLDRLVEISGRICYDSLGKGRSSPDYHKHIIEVGHFSVIEHANLTFEFRNLPIPDYLSICEVLLNRPGVWSAKVVPSILLAPAAGGKNFTLRLTTNLRSIREWFKYPKANKWAEALGKKLQFLAKTHAPLVMQDIEISDNGVPLQVVDPMFDEEIWLSLFVYNVSRGLTHELVRHGDFTAISQRCLAGDTKVKFVKLTKDKINCYKERTIDNLYKLYTHPRLYANIRSMNLYVFDENKKKFTYSKIKSVLYSGKKECFSLYFNNGSKLTCTRDHKILTEKGWKTLAEIANPTASANGVVCWNKNSGYLVLSNGEIAEPLYKDKNWLYDKFMIANCSLKDMAKETGCVKRTISYWLNKYGLKKGRWSDYNPIYKDKTWLYENYYVNNYSLSEMAVQANCSIFTIRTWLRKHRLQKKMCEINMQRVPWNKGKTYSSNKPYSQESIERYRFSKSGCRNPHWKGGALSSARRDFNSWKRIEGKKIYERDGYKCRLCNKTATQVNECHWNKKRTLDINHIIPLSMRPDLSCDTNNMIILCWKCHSSKVTNHELEYVELFQEMIKTPVPYCFSQRQNKLEKHPKLLSITKIKYAGIIDTYDLEVEGGHHNFIANSIVVHNSTRYVDEQKSSWIWHPILLKWIEETNQPPNHISIMKQCQSAYIGIVKQMQEYLVTKGVDKFTARKQSRGAARGILGNALSTELIFSANLSQWKHMILLRGHSAADAEIRLLFNQVYELLSKSYPDRFDNFMISPADDKIGNHIELKKAA